jgi:hypothetical protein
VKVIKNEGTLLIRFEQTDRTTESLLIGTGGQEGYSMCAAWLITMFTNVCGWTLSCAVESSLHPNSVKILYTSDKNDIPEELQ